MVRIVRRVIIYPFFVISDWFILTSKNIQENSNICIIFDTDMKAINEQYYQNLLREREKKQLLQAFWLIAYTF